MKFSLLTIIAIATIAMISPAFAAEYSSDENHLPHIQKQEQQEDMEKLKIPGYRWEKSEIRPIVSEENASEKPQLFQKNKPKNN